MNGQSSDTGNIWYTIHRTKTNKPNTQHRKLKRLATRTPAKPVVNSSSRED